MKNKRIKWILDFSVIAFIVFILAQFAYANISLINPENNSWLDEEDVAFEYGVFNFTNNFTNNTICDLYINGDSENTNNNVSGTNTIILNLGEGEYGWNVTCNNPQKTSLLYYFFIDTTKPAISAPPFSDIITTLDNAEVNFSFSVLDNMDDNLDCSLYVNNELNWTGEVNNPTTNEIITRNLSTGSYSWKIECIDNASNKNQTSGSFEIINPEDEFSMSLNKNQYNIGEDIKLTLNALDGSILNGSVFKGTFPWGDMIYEFLLTENETYPLILQLPYTNQTGDYFIELNNYYGDYSKTLRKNYTVSNSITIQIEGDDDFTTGKSTVLAANAEKGIPPYEYEWDCPSGLTCKNIGNSSLKNITSTNIGEYEITITATDSEGNAKTESFEIEVLPYRYLTVVVKEKYTNNSIKDANVEVGDLSKKTDSHGTAVFKLEDDEYDVYVLKSGYGTYIDSVDLDENITLNVRISIQDIEVPEITLITKNNTVFSDEEFSLKYRVEDISAVDCNLYVADEGSEWFSLIATEKAVINSQERSFVLNKPVGYYKWKIECMDNNKNSAVSDEMFFSVMDIGGEKIEADSKITELDNLLDRIEQEFDFDEKEIAEALGIKEQIEDSLRDIRTAEGNINNIKFRRDLNITQKQDQIQKLEEKINKAGSGLINDITIKNKKSYVKYIRDDSLKDFLEEYFDAKGIDYSSRLFYMIKSQQSMITVSTKIRQVNLIYEDKIKPVTVVIKEINYGNNSIIDDNNEKSGYKLVERIPKNVSLSTENMVFINKVSIIKEDPIIEFDLSEKIVYYFESEKPLDRMEGLDTVIVPSNPEEMASQITGNFFSDIEFEMPSLKVILITVLLILVLFYVSASLGWLEKLKELFIKIFGKKQMEQVNELINEAFNYLEKDDIEKAAMIYREIRLFYPDLGSLVRDKVYDEISGLRNELDLKYMKSRFDKILFFMDKNEQNNVLAEKMKIEKTFENLDPDYKLKIEYELKEIITQLDEFEKRNKV